jgi:hypothetical protein
MANLEQQVRTARQQLASTFQSSGQPAPHDGGSNSSSSSLFGAPLPTALPPSANNKLVLFGESDAAVPAALSTNVVASNTTTPTNTAAPSKPATPLAAFEADAFAFSFLPEQPPPRALA